MYSAGYPEISKVSDAERYSCWALIKQVTFLTTYKHGSHIVWKLLGDDGKGSSQKRGIPHRLHNADDKTECDEWEVTLYLVQ